MKRPCDCDNRKEFLNRAEKVIKGLAARLGPTWLMRLLGVIDRRSKAG